MDIKFRALIPGNLLCPRNGLGLSVIPPYGIHTFLTCVAWASTSRPALIRSSLQSRVTVSHQVCLRLPADAFSKASAIGARAEGPERVDGVVLGEFQAELHAVAGDDVDHAAGKIAGVEHLVEVGGESAALSDGISTAVLPAVIAAAISVTKGRSAGCSGATMPTTPTGSFMASARPRNGGRWTAPSYLSAQAAKVKSRVTAASTSARALPRRAPVRAASRAANSSARAERFSAM